MRVRKGFDLRSLAGENILVATGADIVDFTKMISMNRSAAYLWREAEAVDDFDAEALATMLIEKYEIDDHTAARDSERIIREWLDAGIIEV